jgi:hypothetical protein
MPGEAITGLQRPIGPELLAVAPDLPGGEPLLPPPEVGMGVTSGVEIGA